MLNVKCYMSYEKWKNILIVLVKIRDFNIEILLMLIGHIILWKGNTVKMAGGWHFENVCYSEIHYPDYFSWSISKRGIGPHWRDDLAPSRFNTWAFLERTPHLGCIGCLFFYLFFILNFFQCIFLSSLQHNILRSFCLVLVLWRLLVLL